MFQWDSGRVLAQVLAQVPANFRRNTCENRLLPLLGMPRMLLSCDGLKRANCQGQHILLF